MEQQTETPEVELNVDEPAESEGTEGEVESEVEGEEKSEDEVDGSEGETAEGEEGDADETEEEIEISFGGTKSRFKKGTPIEEVNERIQEFVNSTHKDYISKTQRVAEVRKVVEAQEEGLRQLGSMSEDYYREYGAALRLQQERQELASVDLGALWATQPDNARRISDLMTQKNMELSQIYDRMSAAEGRMRDAHAAAKASAAEAGRRAIEARIPGFTEKHASAVVEYVTKRYNIPVEAAQNWAVSPEVTEMAYKAMLYDRSKATVAKKSPPKPLGKPVAPVRGKGAAVTRPDHLDPKQAERMSGDEWMKAEEARLARLSRRR